MEQTDEAIITGLQARIRDLEQQVIDAKRVVNGLRASKGHPPLYAEQELLVGSSGGILSIKPDQFYGLKVFTAMKQYLAMRKNSDLGPAKLDEIYDALCQGGLKFETENVDNRKINMRFLLRKNSHTFHKPREDYFGLIEWYPEIARKEKESAEGGNNGRIKGRHSKKRPKKKTKPETQTEKNTAGPEKPEATPTDSKTKSDTKAVTQQAAVREAISAMAANFKKQEIIDWIEKKYPDLHATQKRQSILAMLGKLSDEIELVESGKSGGPSTYRRKQK